MANDCKIQFYFKFEEMRALLERNKGAKGIIIKQHIKPVKDANGKKTTNVCVITAEAHGKRGNRSMGIMAEEPANSEPISGCPYPPGCDTES